MADSGGKKINYSFGMEKMKQKDEEARLERMNTKQKRGTPTRDVGLQRKVLFWMMEVTGMQPKGKTDYDHWISDGVILGKVLQSVMFNSIPADMVASTTAATTQNKSTSSDDKDTENRIRMVLKYMRKYGVPESYIFDVDDLREMTNVPKVTRAIAMLGKMSGASTFKDCSIEIPAEDEENGNDTIDYDDDD